MKKIQKINERKYGKQDSSDSDDEKPKKCIPKENIISETGDALRKAIEVIQGLQKRRPQLGRLQKRKACVPLKKTPEEDSNLQSSTKKQAPTKKISFASSVKVRYFKSSDYPEQAKHNGSDTALLLSE